MSEELKEVFNSYPPKFRKKLKDIRKLILKVAKELPEVGPIEESLKWGQPSYAPKKSRVGTPIRIHWLKSAPDYYAIYFNCNSSMVRQIKKRHGDLFDYRGRRAIAFSEDEQIPVEAVEDSIRLALTYFLRKN